MTLAQPSVSMTHLASIVNRTRQNVAKRIGRAAFQNALAEGQLDAIQRVERYGVQAIETLSRRTACCHLRHTNDIPAPSSPRDSRRGQSVSAALLRQGGAT